MASSPAKGFTLVEILIAVAITSFLLMAVYGIFTSVSHAKRRLDTDGQGYHQARVLFDRLGRELRGTYVNRKTIGTLFRGGTNERGNLFLDLTTTAHTPQGGTGAGIVVVRYELLDDRENEVSHKILIRRESPLFHDAENQAEGSPLATGIEEMTLGFFDGQSWLSEWDDRNGSALPQRVSIFLKIAMGERSVPFRSAFEVPVIQVRQ
jgi:general secretion pathway protein J